MADIVKFNLAEMQNLYDEASNYENTFKTGIDELEQLVKGLSEVWTSNETGTYESFKSLFDEKLPLLLSGDECMKEFCDKVKTKKEDFDQAAKDTINLFN